MPVYHAIGLMSGSSLDGLDIAHCRFEEAEGRWAFEILQSDCMPYDEHWTFRLRNAAASKALELQATDVSLGRFFGKQVLDFIARYDLAGEIDLVASHGHTVFHFPSKQMTCQIGDGAAICQQVRIPVVCNFRTADIAAGGQGTPIVPIGDWHLFPEYDLFLNLGGIANASVKQEDNIIAYDICAVNQVLNYLAGLTGKAYDEGGKLAASGKVHQALLDQLNALEYYQWPAPKSLDNSFSRDVVIPVIDQTDACIADKLRTYAEHVAVQVAEHLKQSIDRGHGSTKLFATGGGARNSFLIECIRQRTGMDVVLPGDQIIDYKEAMVMAFMGVLRMRGEINVLSSVTGAEHDTIGGAVYLP